MLDWRMPPNCVMQWSIRFIIGIPVPSVSGKAIVKWVQEQMQSRRTAVLTELVKASAYSDFSTHLYEKLRERSTRNTRVTSNASF